MASPTEEWLWTRLAELDVNRMVQAAGARYESAPPCFVLTCFGQPIGISLAERSVSACSESGKALLARLGRGFPMLALGYLAHIKEAPFAGRLINPAQLPSGEFFERGSHVLPLDRLAKRYGGRPDDWQRVGRELRGARIEYGDMSLELWPFPKLPITLIVWSGDDEFPPRASLLVDANCHNLLPIDIIWSAARLVVSALLK